MTWIPRLEMQRNPKKFARTAASHPEEARKKEGYIHASERGETGEFPAVCAPIRPAQLRLGLISRMIHFFLSLNL